jgi:hypothetical protein
MSYRGGFSIKGGRFEHAANNKQMDNKYGFIPPSPQKCYWNNACDAFKILSFKAHFSLKSQNKYYLTGTLFSQTSFDNIDSNT